MIEQAAADLANRTMTVLIEDRHVRIPVVDGIASEGDYHRARSATASMCWTLAEMPAEQLEPVAEYLSGLLAREPLRSGPLWEPHRVILGLFLLALRQMASELDEAMSRPDLSPAWFRDAVAAFTPTEDSPTIPPAAPIAELDDAFALL